MKPGKRREGSDEMLNDTRNVVFQLRTKVHAHVCLQHHDPEARLRYRCTTAIGGPPHSSPLQMHKFVAWMVQTLGYEVSNHCLRSSPKS